MVAKSRTTCQAAAVTEISDAPQGPAGEPHRMIIRSPAPGTPALRGVIVLTVKLFGETLKTPRTSTVWQGSSAAHRSEHRALPGTAGAIPSRPTPHRSVTQCGGPSIMAKALLGYVGGSDPRLLAEMRRLQKRVQDLESELVRIQDENDALNAAAQHQESLLDSMDIDVPQAEPALT